MGPNGYQTYHDDYFIMDANVKSLCSIPETNIIQYINYIYFFFKRQVLARMWRNGNPVPCWWECTVAVGKSYGSSLKHQAQNYCMPQQVHCWVYAPKD